MFWWVDTLFEFLFIQILLLLHAHIAQTDDISTAAGSKLDVMEYFEYN